MARGRRTRTGAVRLLVVRVASIALFAMLVALPRPSTVDAQGATLLRGRVVDAVGGGAVADAVIDVTLGGPDGGVFRLFTQPDGTFELRTDRPQEGLNAGLMAFFDSRLRGKDAVHIDSLSAGGWRSGVAYRTESPVDVGRVSVQRPGEVTLRLGPVVPVRRVEIGANVPGEAVTLILSDEEEPRRDERGILRLTGALYLVPVQIPPTGRATVDLVSVFPDRSVYARGLAVFHRSSVLSGFPRPLDDKSWEAEPGVLTMGYHFRAASDLRWDRVSESTWAASMLRALADRGAILLSMRPRLLGGSGDLDPIPDLRMPITRREFFDLALRAAGFHDRWIPDRPSRFTTAAVHAVVGGMSPASSLGLAEAAAAEGLIRGKGLPGGPDTSLTWLVTGVHPGDLQLEDPLTRAEAATFLLRLNWARPRVAQSGPFPDVPAGHWAATEIAIGHELGLVEGFPDGLFRPDTAVTVEQAVAMTYRAFLRR